MAKSREWGIRCFHESKLYPYNGFITLTYSDDNLPDEGKLVKEDLQKFIRGMRNIAGNKIRYFACGEYGELTRRPHYHLISFGNDWRGGEIETSDTEYHSPLLAEIWPHGRHSVGNLDAAGCFYVAGYEQKKIGDKDTFTLMSRNIGKEFVLQNREQLARLGKVVVINREWPIPKAYFKWLGSELDHVKDQHRDFAKQKDYFESDSKRRSLSSQIKSEKLRKLKQGKI